MKGMFWFLDNKKKSPNEQLREALDYYANKYGKVPTLVHVHPTQFDKFDPVDGLVIASASITLNHLLIGMDVEEIDKPEEVTDGIL